MSKKAVLEFLLLVVVGGFCIFLIFQMLLNSHPRISPKVQEGSQSLHSSLRGPALFAPCSSSPECGRG